MKRIGAEDNRSLWYLFLTAALPVFACALSAAFVALCFVYSRVRPFVTIELGEESPDVEAFLCGEYADAAFIAAPKVRYRAAGAYPLRVFANGRSVLTYLRVTDTQAPRAEGTETTVALGQVLTPDKLIKNLRDESIVKAWADYGCKVPACVSQGSITAFQFHPEKSGKAGLRILQNYIEGAKC